MFVGRGKELQFLEERYAEAGSQLIVLYGREGIGKSELVANFVKDRPHKYYYVDECSERELGRRIDRQWQGRWGRELVPEDALPDREILIFDEFHRAVRPEGDFLPILEMEAGRPGSFIILISSSVNWVENDLVSSMGRVALKVTSFLKLKEFGLMEMISLFPKLDLHDCIRTYAVTGGIPGYLAVWDARKSFEDNVTALFLKKTGKLYNEAERFLRTELREFCMYNTVLYALANGMNKLNDIYDYTGFSRAKISVYIKHLIGLDIVEKVFSYDTAAKENTKKGVYRIKDFYILFYYRYIFDNRSFLEFDKDSDPYDVVLKDNIDSIFAECYKKLCFEYIELLNAHGRLPINAAASGSWYGKKGDIDYIGTDTEGQSLAAFCVWQEDPLGVFDLKKKLTLLNEAGIDTKYVYLFSKNGFTDELKNAVGDNVKLIALSDM